METGYRLLKPFINISKNLGFGIFSISLLISNFKIILIFSRSNAPMKLKFLLWLVLLRVLMIEPTYPNVFETSCNTNVHRITDMMKNNRQSVATDLLKQFLHWPSYKTKCLSREVSTVIFV